MTTGTRNASKVNITGSRDAEGTHIGFKFPSGTERSFTLTREDPLYDDFAAHGVGKKVRDQLAATKTEQEAVEALDALLKSFGSGKWNTLRNGDGAPQAGLLTQALAAHTGRTLEDAQTFVAKLTKKQQADLRAEASIAAEIAKIKGSKVREVSAEVSGLLESFKG